MLKDAEPKQNNVLLRMQTIVKDFPGTRALDAVDFDVQPGQVHALIGENGAGKSTLMNVLAGRFADYKGTILFNGRNVHITNPRHARKMGLSVIYQELSVLPNLTVAENIMLGDEQPKCWSRRLSRASLNTAARETIDYLGFDLNPCDPVAALSTARQCLVEIAGAIRRNVKLLVFDEPTAALGSEDVDKLFKVVKDLKNRGLGIVYISHRLAELPRIADDVTVLRDGRVVGSGPITDFKLSDLTGMMLGHELAEVFGEKTNKPGKVILKVDGLSRPGAFDDVSFELREGEILGIAGLVGSGRTEIARAIFGADKASGNVEFQNKLLKARSPNRCSRLGIAMVPENRKREGIITGRPLSENLNISILDRLAGPFAFQSPKCLRANAIGMIERMKIDPPQPRVNIQNLSGGNQQKAIVGRWLAARSKIIIFDEPTQGIDVGTKSQVYKLIMELACHGCGIILISSEFIEITELADRILIVRDGRVVRQVRAEETNEDALFAECAGKVKREHE